MTPLSTISSAGINVKSSHPTGTFPLTAGRLAEHMAETQENIRPEDSHAGDINTDNQFTIKAAHISRSPTKATFSDRPLSLQRVNGAPVNTSPSRSPEVRAEAHVDEDMMDVSQTDSHGFDPDNTCFSAFSAVPAGDTTAFARLGQSNGIFTPNREHGASTRNSRPTTPSTMKPTKSELSPTRGPNKSPTRVRNDLTTPPLLEFTEQINYQTKSGSRQTSPIRSRGQDLMAGAGHRMRSPEGRTLNLLDFDLPPAPTPRSVPSISARELESLKAGFLSEISSLKAKLSGAQAEIKSLKEAKDDAEHRVGTLSEELRDANGAKVALQQEKEDWKKHDAERRETLAKLKEEYVSHETEIGRLREEADEQNKRFQDMENRASDAEGKLQEAEGKLAGYREEAANADGTNPTTPGSNKAVEVAVEKVAKELHLLYKSKHEQKVAALKQSYEKRWKKKVDELAFQVEQLEKENADIRTGRDATLSGEVLGADGLARTQQKNEDAALQAQVSNQEQEDLRREIEELNKRMETMSRGVTMLERDNVTLRNELQESRKENSDLVGVVDEMLAMDLSAPAVAPQSRPSSLEMPNGASDPAVTGLKPSTSSSKISGLRGPGFGAYGESRIGGGMMGLKRSVSGAGSRSGIMSNIERMGRGIGGRGGQE